MADQNKNVTVNNEAEETQATETKVEQQNAAPEASQAETGTQEKEEKKEHPKWDAFKAGAKKAGKWIGLGAAVVGGLFVANKLGQAKGQAEGFNAACDGLAKANPDPVLELPQNDIGTDTIADADFSELDVTADPVIDTPAE